MEFDKAKKIAAKLISFKMYTCKEILQKLIQKDISQEISELVVSEFCKAGILDDAEYARAYIHDGLYVHMKGMYRIKQELIKKGVASSVIEKAKAHLVRRGFGIYDINKCFDNLGIKIK